MLGTFEAQPKLPLLQSGKRPVSFHEVSVLSGTKEVVQMRMVSTNMRFLPKESVPQNPRGTVVEDDPRQGPIRQRVKARRNVFSGRGQCERGAKCTPMKDHQESRGKPRQIHLKWQEKRKEIVSEPLSEAVS